MVNITVKSIEKQAQNSILSVFNHTIMINNKKNTKILEF